eukprot:1679215-Rhodomonas_salina.2
MAANWKENELWDAVTQRDLELVQKCLKRRCANPPPPELWNLLCGHTMARPSCTERTLLKGPFLASKRQIPAAAIAQQITNASWQGTSAASTSPDGWVRDEASGMNSRSWYAVLGPDAASAVNRQRRKEPASSRCLGSISPIVPRVRDAMFGTERGHATTRLDIFRSFNSLLRKAAPTFCRGCFSPGVWPRRLSPVGQGTGID